MKGANVGHVRWRATLNGEQYVPYRRNLFFFFFSPLPQQCSHGNRDESLRVSDQSPNADRSLGSVDTKPHTCTTRCAPCFLYRHLFREFIARQLETLRRDSQYYARAYRSTGLG